ncbi:MAG: SlyX family protein [Treponemataceae bacterium]|nr:SlyX family protein [Treponemataceae bacterium]
MNDEERMTLIETKLAYLEDFMNQIQQVSVEHEKELEKLRKENKLMIEKIKDMSDSLEGDIPNRKPPHY